jgi:hypothetical protein
MKLKIPLPSFERSSHQAMDIERNRYVIDLDTKDYCFANVVHEVFWGQNQRWATGYSWCTLGVDTAYRSEIMKDRRPPTETYMRGLVKCFEDYYDGPIVTWELGPLFVNYRW